MLTFEDIDSMLEFGEIDESTAEALRLRMDLNMRALLGPPLRLNAGEEAATAP
jgi:hypothetical protein